LIDDKKYDDLAFKSHYYLHHNVNNYKECSACNEIIMNDEYHDCTSHDLGYTVSSANLISQRAVSGIQSVNSLIADPYHSDYNIFGVDKTKIIERLEKDVESAKSTTCFAEKRHKDSKNENAILQKNITKVEKKNKKITRERDLLKFELKILKDVNRNLLHRLDNS